MSRVLAIALAAAALAAHPAAGLEPRVRLVLEAPADGERIVSPVPLVEFRGRASGSHPLSLDSSGPDAESLLQNARRAHLVDADVVLALDLSNTALHSSGFDVDGDGTVGRDKPWVARNRHFDRSIRVWTSDWDDVIAHAEIAIARELAPRLDALGNRVALLLFASGARVRTSLGPGREVLQALDRIRLRMDPDGTDLTRALRRTRRLLKNSDADAPEGGARRAVILFSDAKPSSDLDRHAEGRAIERAARGLADDGVRLHVLAFGPREDFDPWLLPSLAEMTRGRFVHATDLAAPLEGLGLVEPWRPRRVRVWNRTARRDARALRLFPNGRFDGFAPLVPGRNLLSVEIRGPGNSLELERWLEYEPTDAGGAEPEILEKLRRRTLETRAAGAPPPPERRLDIELDQTAPPHAPAPGESP
ncbi:MAG: VWA domain-containing protein [Proteobacteria bacterium]|nr:VWA domain-containing protein [Pseudomonadota bacterium]